MFCWAHIESERCIRAKQSGVWANSTTISLTSVQRIEVSIDVLTCYGKTPISIVLVLMIVTQHTEDTHTNLFQKHKL